MKKKFVILSNKIIFTFRNMFEKNYKIIDYEVILKGYWQINFMSEIETKPWVIITVFKEQVNLLDIKKITPQI